MKGKERHQPTKNTIDTKFVFEFPLCGARIQVPYIHTRHDPKQKSSPPTHYCSILSFLKPQQHFTRLYLLYQSCKSFFTPFYWINGKKMTSSSHTNLATSTISESHICKPQKQQKWHVSLFLSFSHDLSSFEMIYSAVFGKFATFFTLSLNSVVVGLDTICNKSYEMMWFWKLWMGCLFDTKFSLAEMPCMHACMNSCQELNQKYVITKIAFERTNYEQLHLNVPTMNNRIWTYQLWTIIRWERLGFPSPSFKFFWFVEAACRGFFFSFDFMM